MSHARPARRRRLFALAGAAVLAAFSLMPHPWLTTNDVTVERVYAAPAARVFAEAEAACRALPRWTVTKTDPVGNTLSAEVRTAFGGFTDDVTASVVPNGSATARITIRSRSRAGRGDLGENARHVRALLRTLDARLPRAQE